MCQQWSEGWGMNVYHKCVSNGGGGGGGVECVS